MQDPDPDFRPTPGLPEPLGPMVRRLLAPNPSPMTFRGTNTYLIGETEIAVIDPGPNLPDHHQAILDALTPGQTITHIIVTHAHLDHSPLARPLSDSTGAPVLAFGDAEAGRSPIMAQLAATGLLAGGEGVDRGFQPDQCLAHGDTVSGEGWTLEALHTPGHFGNHIALAFGDVLFSGDLVMGWASSLVSPPDGDLTGFMTSCRMLLERSWSVFHPGHGAPITNPHARTQWLIDHRLTREAEILSQLSQAPGSASELAARIYTDVAPALLPAASRNVLAHLIDLYGKSRVTPNGPLSAEAQFSLI